MWGGIFFVGVIMAAGTLLLIDGSLPGGLIKGDGDLRYAQTMGYGTHVPGSAFQFSRTPLGSTEVCARVRLGPNSPQTTLSGRNRRYLRALCEFAVSAFGITSSPQP